MGRLMRRLLLAAMLTGCLVGIGTANASFENEAEQPNIHLLKEKLYGRIARQERQIQEFRSCIYDAKKEQDITECRRYAARGQYPERKKSNVVEEQIIYVR